MLGLNMGSLRGAGMVVLQILRACTVITLAAVGASYWVLIVKVDKQRSFFVFECASHFFMSVLCLVLIVAEFPLLGMVKTYFRKTWPVLSEHHGVAWLGIFMAVMACDLLGNLNRKAYDAENLGPDFSKLVLAASVLALTFGFINIACSLVWRDGKEGITSRDIRANGSLADSRRQSLPSYSSTDRASSSLRNEKTRGKFVSMFWKKDGPKKDKPTISGPFPAQQDMSHADQDLDRRSPIVPGLKRPDTALHPMHNGYRQSTYSEAQMSRF
ncbi:hypothetical protein HIM_01565 [Hirsutella minnesotensis 3608]|nr:hypothetical protein HIM_01565 [Hirsutella minnesotensis 3608]